MAHSEHNRNKRSGGFFLIILGALIFITVPLYLSETQELGLAAIVFGFIIGGIGFYITFIRNKMGGKNVG